MKKISGIIAVLIVFILIGVAWAAVTATWDAASGIVTGHKIYYRIQGDPASEKSFDTGQAATSQDITTITDALAPGVYEFWVTAYNVQLDGVTKQEGFPSNTVTWIKEVPVPGACSNFQIN